MHITKVFSQLKTRKNTKKQHLVYRDFSDYSSLSTSDRSSFSSTTTSSDLEDGPSIDELEYFFESSHKSRYHEQDVQLNSKQELDLELARLSGLLERGGKLRLASQDFVPSV